MPLTSSVCVLPITGLANSASGPLIVPVKRNIQHLTYFCFVFLMRFDHNEKDGGCTFYQNALGLEMV